MSSLDTVIGASERVAAGRDEIARFLERQGRARRLPPVLILGETGTGKGHVARAIHGASGRARGPFVAVNCAAIPESLLESELFGCARGAFTGAAEARAGLFQAAQGGVLFLDEIGFLPLAVQAKLLTAIEDLAVRRLGSTRSEPVDIWVLAATSDDLLRATREQRFLAALYHRLAVLTVRLPPLRERTGDIRLLAEHFLARACAEYGLPAAVLTADALAALEAYDWPGNVRELAHAIERAALLADGEITGAALGLPARRPAEAPAGGRADEEPAAGERRRVLEALETAGGNLSHAAAALGVPRNTLRYRLQKHGLLRREGTEDARAAAVPELRPRAPTPRILHPTRAGPELDPSARCAPSVGAPSGWGPRIRRDGTSASFDSARPSGPRSAQDERGCGDEPSGGRRMLVVLRVAGETAPDAVEKIRAFGGRVDEIGPAGVLAVFPPDHEDPPRLAAEAAWAVRHTLGPDVRIALHRDELDDPREAAAVLDALVAGLPPGGMAATAALAPFLERRFALVALAPAPAGAPGAVALAGRTPARRLARFVGREEELGLVLARLAAACQGRGQIVGIVGEPGIGKSRLLAELRRRRAGGLSFIEGRCAAHGAAIPYFPLVDLLRQGCQIADSDGRPAIAMKLRRRLEWAGLDPDEGAPLLLRLLGLAAAPDPFASQPANVVKARTFDVLRRLLLDGAPRRPAIVAVEDIHWIDPASEEFLASLAAEMARARLVLVVTYRPGRRPPWVETSYATQIALPPLRPDDARSVVRDALAGGEMPEPVIAEVLGKGEGNPFFLEELVRALEAEGDASRVVVPETVRGVLRARIERLPPPARRTLKAAAVLGREVPAQVLRALRPDAAVEVERDLRELKGREFLDERHPGGERVLAFRHALTQEVAYELLSPAEREALHGLAGRSLEALHQGREDEACELLAYHYGRSADREKALEFLIRANRKADGAHAVEAAKTFFDEANRLFDALPDTPERRLARVSLLVEQEYVMLTLGRYPEYDALLRRSEPVARELGDEALLGVFLSRLGHCQWALGSFREAFATLLRAEELCERTGRRVAAGFACLTRQWGHFCLGEFEAAIRLTDEVFRKMGEQRNSRWAGFSMSAALTASLALGRFADARRLGEEAIAFARKNPDRSALCFCGWRLAEALAIQGDLEAAVRYAEMALAEAPTPGDERWAGGALGFALCKSGRTREGVPLLEKLDGWAPEFIPGAIDGQLLVAEGFLLAGDLERARARAEAVVATADRCEAPSFGAWARRIVGEVALAQGDDALAESCFEDARAASERVGAENERALSLAGLGRVRLRRGERETARALLERALETFERLGTLREPERVRALLAECA